MAGMYSDVDFNRMQEQLLQLRESSYKSDEKCRAQEKELIILKENLSVLERELNKANQIINKSKRAKDYELALNEIQSLQRKILNQEEDWKLQNKTLMVELAQLVRTNESLEKELKERKKRDDDDEGGGEMVKKEEYQMVQDELRRLQAQYSALLKCSKNVSEKSDQIQCLNNSNSEEKHDNQAPSDSSMNLTDENIPVDQGFEDLQLKFETEREENSLLKKQLSQLELEYKDELSTLKQEIEQVSEKLKKKQESILQLQEAKDKLFTEMSSKLEAVQQESEILLKESQEKFDQESQVWSEKKKGFEDNVLRVKKKYVELHNEKKKLEEQMVARGQESSQSMRDLQVEFEAKIKKQMEVINSLKEKIENLRIHLKESQASHHSATEEIASLRSERDDQALKLLEVNKVADKRKALLDQLAMKYQEDSDQHKDQLKDLKKNHDSSINDLNLELSQFKTQVKELKLLEEECDGVKGRLKNVENTKNMLEQSLSNVEKELISTKEENESKLSELTINHISQISDLEKVHSDKLQELEGRLSAKESEVKELNEVVKRYEQMVKDHEEDKKIHEKKGSTVVKDLKRQLHSERKRAEKLQEKLQEILSESKNRQSVEDLFRPHEDRLKLTDNSSLSSWSPSGLSRDNLMSQCSLQGTDEESSDTTLRQENDSLVRRIGELLLKVSTLEEKVSHLESSNASMAEDLLQKTAVIDHYRMDVKSGQSSSSSHPNDNKMSLKRMKEFVMDKNDDKKDMKRLQRMLEETLTKNMHLQNDLEMMSIELSNLRSQPTS